MFVVVLFTIAKTWNQPKCPTIIGWIKKIWHIDTMEYYAAIKKDKFMSFAGTWMKPETLILSKLTQEQKTKHCMFSLINENTWSQGGEHHTLWPLRGWGARRRRALGEIPNVDDELVGATNKYGTCIPM